MTFADTRLEEIAKLPGDLREEASYYEYERLMASWDRWRAYIAKGGQASWPRDDFESLTDETGDLLVKAAGAIIFLFSVIADIQAKKHDTEEATSSINGT